MSAKSDERKVGLAQALMSASADESPDKRKL